MSHATPPSPLSAPLFCLQLQPGCRVWEYLPRAADITVAEGSIVVHQRLVLAGMWVHLPVVVPAGEQFRVGAGGWVEMEAVGAARVHGIMTTAWWQIVWMRLTMQRRGRMRTIRQQQKKLHPL